MDHRSFRIGKKETRDAPHLIYLPERPFNEEEFLEDVKKLYDEKGGVVVVASEGLKELTVSRSFGPSLKLTCNLLRRCQRALGKPGDPEAGYQGKKRETRYLWTCFYRMAVTGRPTRQ